MNKNKKIFFLFTTLIILLVGISCTSAANVDDNTTTVETNTVETNTPETSSTYEKVVDKTVEKTTTQENNKKTSTTITEEDYSTYFDEDSIAKPTLNNTDVIFSGSFSNKNFTFDNVIVNIAGDEDSVLINSTITSQNNAIIALDGITITNENQQAIYLESTGNIINNSAITVTSKDKIFAIEINDDDNSIINTVIDATIPSADVEYNTDYSTKSPAPAAILITTNNNLIDGVIIAVNGTEIAENSTYPTINGIYIVSSNETITNNTITNTNVSVTGSKYVYGINVGNAANTEISDVTVTPTSEYYANAIQLFDADGIEIDGTLIANGGSEAYGIYSTAMGTGNSEDVVITDIYIIVSAPKATGVLFEGTEDASIDDAMIIVNGENATGVAAYVDWMGNIPTDIIVYDNVIYIETNGTDNVLYFGLCDDVIVNDNIIYVIGGGSEINLNSTTNAEVTENYISINNTVKGNKAVKTTENDSVIKNNIPTALYDTTITINPIIASVGEIGTISASVVDEYGNNVTSGRVVFKANGVTLKDETGNTIYGQVTDGTASINYKIPEGWTKNTTTIQAVYSGDNKYSSSRANQTDVLNISLGTATINLDQNVYTTKSGKTITFKAIVKDETGNLITSGKVIFKLNGNTIKDENGTALYAIVENGIATFEYTVPDNYSAKNYTLTAVYSGNYYERAETDAILTLEKKDVTIEDIQTSTIMGTTTIKASIYDENGKLLTRSTKLAIKINGKTFVTGVNSTNGIIDVSFNHTLSAGLYELLIISGENNLYNTGRSTSVLKLGALS